MIETRRLNVVIFFQTILSFVLSRNIINIYNDIARKYKKVGGSYLPLNYWWTLSDILNLSYTAVSPRYFPGEEE